MVLTCRFESRSGPVSEASFLHALTCEGVVHFWGQVGAFRLPRFVVQVLKYSGQVLLPSVWSVFVTVIGETLRL